MLTPVLRPARLDGNSAALDPAELMQPLHESGDPLAVGRRRAGTEVSDCRQLARLLRPCSDWPYRRRAAEQRDEHAAPHSITSSASASSFGGMSSPRALAVLRLMSSSNFVGCSIGRSPG